MCSLSEDDKRGAETNNSRAGGAGGLGRHFQRRPPAAKLWPFASREISSGFLWKQRRAGAQRGRRAGNHRGFAAPPSWGSAVGGGGCLLMSCTCLASQHGALELLTAGTWRLAAARPRHCVSPGTPALGTARIDGCRSPVTLLPLANYSWEMFIVPYAGF